MNDHNLTDDPSLAHLEEHSRKLLATSAAVLPGRIQSRLTAARNVALEQRAHRPRTLFGLVPAIWLPLGSVAAAAVVAVALWTARPAGVPVQATVAEATTAEDAEMLASNEGPDLVADDADFYEWAGSDPAAGPG